jgi:hypothetical protein
MERRVDELAHPESHLEEEMARRVEGRYYERRQEHGFDAQEWRHKAENPQEVL